MTDSTAVTAGTHAEADQYNNLRRDLLLGQGVYYSETDGGTITFDLDNVDRGNVRVVELGGNRTLALSNVDVGQKFVIVLKQDANGGRTVTWWSGIKWPAAIVPTLSTTANKYDVFGFICIASNTYLGCIISQGNS